MPISVRLSWLSFGAAVYLAMGVAIGLAADIRVLNWQGYGTDFAWAIAGFESDTGHTVGHEYFSSESEMLDKLRSNPGAYDVVLVNSAFTGKAAELGLIKAIDPSDLSNFADLEPHLSRHASLTPGGDVYGIAWVWGVTGLAVDVEEVVPVPPSLQALWDERFRGRVGWRDDALESVQFAALATGQDINKIKDISAVRSKLEALMPQIGSLWREESEWNTRFADGDYAHSAIWSGTAGQAVSEGLPIGFVIPDEGAIGWLDGLSIPAATQNEDAAKAFINHMIEPDFYARWAESGAPVPANERALAALPADDLNHVLLNDLNVLFRIQFAQPVTAEVLKTYRALWEAVKASAKPDGQ